MIIEGNNENSRCVFELKLKNVDLFVFFYTGTYYNDSPSMLHSKLNKKYGPIVRLEGIGTKSFVLLFDPIDVEKASVKSFK